LSLRLGLLLGRGLLYFWQMVSTYRAFLSAGKQGEVISLLFPRRIDRRNAMQTEMQIGKMFVIVHSEFNPAATETLEMKIRNLLLRHIDAEKSLAIPAEQSQYGQQPKEVLE
jgi:hypothetical protein